MSYSIFSASLVKLHGRSTRPLDFVETQLNQIKYSSNSESVE